MTKMTRAEAEAIMDMMDGYGVEDVAARRAMPIEQLRRLVSGLRASGNIHPLVRIARRKAALDREAQRMLRQRRRGQ